MSITYDIQKALRFDYARKLLLDQLEKHKKEIEMHITNSTRRWDELEKAVSQYKECLIAADVLGGYIDIYGEKVDIKE